MIGCKVARTEEKRKGGWKKERTDEIRSWNKRKNLVLYRSL